MAWKQYRFPRITRTTLLEMLKTGKFVSVDFRKKNEQMRTITGRVGVSKHTNGKGLSYDPAERGMIVIWEANKANRRDKKDKGYRMVTLDRITRICADKREFII